MKILAMEKRKDKTAYFQMSIIILSSSAHASFWSFTLFVSFHHLQNKKILVFLIESFTHTSTWKFEFKAR